MRSRARRCGFGAAPTPRRGSSPADRQPLVRNAREFPSRLRCVQLPTRPAVSPTLRWAFCGRHARQTRRPLQPKNGRASTDVSTATPTVGARAAGCPNGNWRVIVGDVEFTSYTLTISQGGQLVVTCEGSFSPSPAQNGQTSTPTCTFA